MLHAGRDGYNYKGKHRAFPWSFTEGDGHARGIEILLDVRLRAKSRQFDEQAPHGIQTTHPRYEADPRRRRLLRAIHQRGTSLLEIEVRPIPR